MVPVSARREAGFECSIAGYRQRGNLLSRLGINLQRGKSYDLRAGYLPSGVVALGRDGPVSDLLSILPLENRWDRGFLHCLERRLRIENAVIKYVNGQPFYRPTSRGIFWSPS